MNSETIQKIIPKLNTVEGASELLRELGYGEFLEEPLETPEHYWHIERRKTGIIEPLAKSGMTIATPGKSARLYSYFYELNDDSCDRFGRIKITAFRPIAQKHASDTGVPLLFFAPPEGEDSDEVVLATFTKLGKIGGEDRIALRWVRFHRDNPNARTPLDVLEKLPFDKARHIREIILSAFALEPLTDKFYREYKDIFDNLKAGLVAQLAKAKDKDQPEERAHEFASLLMNRLMFLWFVQKKGWLDGKQNYLLKLFDDYGEKNFYADRVQHVFNMLNSADNDTLRKSIRENYAFDPGQLPFLNGGLFDDLDAIEQTSRDKTTFKIDNSFFKDIFHNLFQKYNFTVEESTPQNIEIAVDPEMLGHVFEQMVTGRHESGSYYTPKQVVNFMCKEAIKGYLRTQTDETETAISALVDGDSRDGIKDIQLVNNTLNKIVTCDPACGSGAYLLGMLHNIIEIQKTLMNIGETDTGTLHRWKQRIISQSIYGVDIDPFAVSIAKLRLWLSLVVDETRDPLSSNKPDVALPNLEFKIETGDSLTAPDPSDREYSGDMFQMELLKLADELGELKDEFLRTHDSKGKEALRGRIHSAENRLRGCLQAERTLPPNAFDWRVEFAEVFRRDGFDVVIANPPYGATIATGLRDIFFQNENQSKDSYGIFIIRGLQLLKPKGIFSFIVSDTWRTIKTHKPLRKRILENATVFHVLDVPSWIFGATVNTTILTMRNTSHRKDHEMITGDLRGIPNGEWDMLSENLKKIAGNAEDEQNVYYARYTYPQAKVGEHENLPFFIGSPDIYRMMTDDDFIKMGDIATVKHGLTTGKTREYIYKSNKKVRGSYRVARKEDIFNLKEHRENLHKEEKHNGINPKDYNDSYLLPYDKGGASDTDEGLLPVYWQPTEYYINWSKKAVNSMKKLKGFRHDGKEFYFLEGITFSHTGYYAPTFRINEESVFDTAGSCIFFFEKANRYFFLAMLNSNIVKYLFKNFINHTVNVAEKPLELIPLPSNTKTNTKVVSLVKEIILNKERDKSYPYYENEQPKIDRIVYELYGLSEEEIAEVEIWYCRRYPKLAKAWGLWDKYPERTGGKEGSGSESASSETVAVSSETQSERPERPADAPESIAECPETPAEAPEIVTEAPETVAPPSESPADASETVAESSENVAEAPETRDFRLRAKDLPEQKRIEYPDSDNAAPIDPDFGQSREEYEG